MKKAFICLVLLGLGWQVGATDLEVNAGINTDKIGLDDTLIYTLTIRGVTNPKQPTISFGSDFIVTFTSQSVRSSFTILNNTAQTGSAQVDFIYYLKPTKTGKLTIPEMSFKYNNNEFKTPTFSVEVVKGSIGSPPSSPKTQWPFTDEEDDFPSIWKQRSAPPELDVLMKNQLSKQEVFEGEMIIAVIQLFTRNQIESVSMMSNPSFPGFWLELFPVPDVYYNKYENFKGKRYQVFEVRKMVLFANKNGKLALPSVKFQLNLGGGLSFFSNPQIIYRSSPEVDITVKPLPQDARQLPVGDFKLSVEPNKTESDINDILTVKITIQGVGNIKTLPVPLFENNDDFSVYPAKISRQFNFQDPKFSGKLVAEVPVSFKKKGDITFGAIGFKYFDPQLEKVITLSSSPFSVRVTGTKNELESAVGFGKTAIIKKGEDIDFIKKGEIFDQREYFYQKIIFAILIILPFIFNGLILLISFIDRWVLSSHRFKNRKILSSTLKKISQIKDYGEISPVLEGYICEKTQLGLSQLTNERIESLLFQKGIRETDIKKILDIKNRSELSRFSPLTIPADKLKHDLHVLIQILKKIDGWLK